MSISTVTPVANSSGAAALSAVGIGSGLDVNSIVSKLMEVESLPLTQLNSQVSSYQATLSAYGTVNSALSTFQSSVESLNSSSMFSTLSVTPSNTSILSGTATATAIAGSYNVNVTQLAQAQSLATAGQASTSSAISGGAGSDNFVGAALSSSVATEGIAAGSLTLNGTAIATDSSTTSATALAAQINLATGATGVTATITQPSSTGTVTFTPVTTGSSDSYSLQVGNTVVASLGANSGLTAAQLDSALQTTGFGSVGAALTADGVSFTGTAEAGTLKFTKADGSNLSISQTLTNTSSNSSGGITGLSDSGTAQTYLGGVTLTSSNPITVGGSAPSAAGLGSTITFQFGAISANLVGSGSVDYSGGIAAGSLTLNGTAIATGSSTTSAASLATQINLTTGATGITAAVSDSGAVTLTSANPITVAGSDPTLAGFTAGSTLTNGTYNNSIFTPGTSVGGGTIAINSSNDTLQGIASAINSANLGVTATIIDDGSSSPYRLSLTSNATGAASSMKISVNGDAALSTLLSNDPAGTQNLTQSVNAQNSALTINGIPITSANNTVSGAIQGVTLNLSQVGTTSVAIAQNSTSIQSAVSALVTAYNTLNSTLNAATAYNATTQTAGPLIGDSGVETIRAQLRQLLGTPIAGANQNLNSLGQLGITFQNDGSLSLNTSTLQSALTNNFSSVGALFSAIGTTSDSLVGFNTSTAATQPGTYAVNITQLATQGTEVGSAAPGLTITGGSNDQLSLLIDGINTTVTLTAGTYTPTSLAAEMQTAINGATAISNAGSSVDVSVNSSGALSITSQRYGSASSVSLGGDAASTLLGSVPASTAGLDVAGTIGGNPAVGSGKVLTGTPGSSTAGMALSINGGTIGSRGTVTFSQGYAYQLNKQLASFLGSSGPLTVESNAINNNITSINAQIATLNITLAAQQANYLAEFTALDTTMASMDATQTYLTTELASLSSSSG